MDIPNYANSKYSIKGTSDYIIGADSRMEELFKQINALANRGTTVLIRGKTGTGKDLTARALHYNRDQNGGNFVAVNSTAIPEALLESDLFGYVRGAFTGATADKPGQFDYANGGTIFFDEIGDMPPALQAKILRVLQDRTFVPVGGLKPHTVNVRVVAATNRDLERMIKEGSFREDLYYRLNVYPVRTPSLNERRGDILLVADYLIEKFNRNYNAQVGGLSSHAKTALMEHNWTGNIRELENVIERIFVLKHDGPIGAGDLTFDQEQASDAPDAPKHNIRINEHIVDELFRRLTVEHESFDGAVRLPFLGREITRFDLYALVEKGLEETRGNYSTLCILYNAGDYKRFYNFLRKHKSNPDFRKYRMGSLVQQKPQP